MKPSTGGMPECDLIAEFTDSAGPHPGDRRYARGENAGPDVIPAYTDHASPPGPGGLRSFTAILSGASSGNDWIVVTVRGHAIKVLSAVDGGPDHRRTYGVVVRSNGTEDLIAAFPDNTVRAIFEGTFESRHPVV